MSLKTIIPSLLLTFVFASCSEEQANIPEAKGHITFSLSGESRNTHGGTFEKGDSIGVFVRYSGADFATNSKYVYDGKIFHPATEADDIVIANRSEFDFYAYYPYDRSQKDITNITHSSINQDALSGWLSSDFMTASYTDEIVDFCVPLTFSHRNSTVEVHINKNDGVVTGALIKNVKYRSSHNLLTGGSKVDDTTTDLRLYSYQPDNNGNTLLRVTLPEQTLSTKTNLIQFTGGANLTLQGTSHLQLKAGKIHQYNITYKKTVSIKDYEPGGTTSGSGEYSLGSTATVTSAPKPGYEFAGWYESNALLSALTTYEFEVMRDYSLEPRYKSFSPWEVTIDANPTQIKTSGGTSAITATAQRKTLINGVEGNSETATPQLSSSNPAFVIEGMTVRVGENPGESERTAVITATHGGVSKSVTLTQPGKTVTYVFTINGGSSVTTKLFESKGGSQTITIVSTKTTVMDGVSSSPVPANWSYKWDGAFGTLGKDGTLTINANPNKTPRSGLITLTQEGSGKIVTIDVNQKPKNEIIIEPQ